MFSGCGAAFDGAGSWSFGDDSAGNLVIFGVDNNSSSYTDNCKNSFLMLGEGPPYHINCSFSAAEKRLGFILVKRRQNLAGVCIMMVIVVICSLTEKKLIIFLGNYI